MNFREKFQETLLSVLPIMAIVLILHFTVAQIETSVLINFILGGVSVVLGLTIFLGGVDMGISPMGERCGAALTAKKNLFLLLSVSFVIGVFVTFAEPDVSVLASQVKNATGNVNSTLLILMISLGVGLFVSMGIFRTILSIPLKPFLFVSYILVFALAFLSDKAFQGIAFDSGGATTGPMTVPFIMALGLGVSAVRSRGSSKNHSPADSEDAEADSFGLTGIASIGPVAAVCLYGIFFAFPNASPNSVSEAAASTNNSQLLVSVLQNVVTAMSPLVALFVIFQLFLLKLPKMQVIKTIRGFIYSFAGLVIFMWGAESGFIPAGEILGKLLANDASTTVGKIILLTVSLIFGAVVVCSEPAVWVLTEQVENVSGGTIKRKMLLASLSVGVAISIVLSVLKILYGFSIFYILIPGYLISMVLMIFCPKLFTGIAFDSGGVASGPMTSTFILSFTMGISSAVQNSNSNSSMVQSAFGVIALVAMTPLIAIQVLGIIFRIKQHNMKKSIVQKAIKKGGK